MPYMDDVFFEPDNADRAGFAEIALDAYARQTHHDPREQSVDVGDSDQVAEVMSDLLCDLMHLADQAGVQFEEILERGRFHYDFEVAEEEEEDPPICDKCDEELVGDDPRYCPICDKEEGEQ